MKARIKATGEEIEVMQVYEKGDSFYVRLDMLSTTEVRYHISELEFEGIESSNQLEPDYWTRLEHQAAIAAMQGIIGEGRHVVLLDGSTTHQKVVERAISVAHALVEKLKEK